MAKYKSRCHLPFISIIFRHYYPTSSPVRKCSIAEYTGFLCHCPWGLQAQMQLPGGIVQKHAATLYRLSPWHPYICISDYISDFSIDCSRAKCSICPCRLVGILATSQLIKWSNSKYCSGGWKAWSRGLGSHSAPLESWSEAIHCSCRVISICHSFQSSDMWTFEHSTAI